MTTPVKSLGAIVFTARADESQLDWMDQYQWSPVGQTLRYALAGNLVIQENARTGRPITLQAELPWCWLTSATVQAIIALAQTPDQTHTLIWEDVPYAVRFRRDPQPYTFTPVDPRKAFFTGQLFLLHV